MASLFQNRKILFTEAFVFALFFSVGELAANIPGQPPTIILEDLLSQKEVLIQKDPPSKKVLTHSLSQTLREGTLGLDLDLLEGKNSFLEQARGYRKVRQSSTRSSERAKFLENCAQIQERQAFCAVLKNFDRVKEKSTNPISWLLDRTGFRQSQVAFWLKKGRLDKLVAVSEKDIRNGLRKIPSSSDLDLLSNSLISSPSCKYTSLRQILGSKLEEYLPEVTVQKRLMQHYERAAICNQGEASQKARFRLSLHYLSQGKCSAALPLFDQLIERSDSSDYKTRALFWKLSCAEKAGDQIAIRKTKQLLAEKYPFSFHAILARKEGSVQKFPVLPKADSQILFRSQKKAQLNGPFRVIEALLSINEPTLAREVMQQAEGELGNAEPEFRLYAVVLYHRMNYHLKNFRLLSSIFRENPAFISKPALELFYPQNVIKAHQVPRDGIDENLLLSLVRQESAFNANAKSSAGALGLMQVMPATARRFERFFHLSKLLDPAFNLKIGAKYFSMLLNRYNGDAELALAAYNAGPGRVDSWLKRYPVQDRVLFLDLIPFSETREYVASIARNYFWYVNLYLDSPEKIGEVPKQKQIANRSLGQMFRLLGG